MKLPDGTDTMASGSFVDFKGIVVHCQQLEPVSCDRPFPLYEVTLFFESITEEHCAALLLASRQRKDLENSSSTLSKPGPSDPIGFDRFFSMN